MDRTSTRQRTSKNTSTIVDHVWYEERPRRKALVDTTSVRLSVHPRAIGMTISLWWSSRKGMVQRRTGEPWACCIAMGTELKPRRLVNVLGCLKAFGTSCTPYSVFASSMLSKLSKIWISPFKWSCKVGAKVSKTELRYSHWYFSVTVSVKYLSSRSESSWIILCWARSFSQVDWHMMISSMARKGFVPWWCSTPMIQALRKWRGLQRPSSPSSLELEDIRRSSLIEGIMSVGHLNSHFQRWIGSLSLSEWYFTCNYQHEFDESNSHNQIKHFSWCT